jgi:toluene monooxygenase electron transfer component
VRRHRIELEGLPQPFECGEDESVLHAALRSGIGFPYECSSGSCGTCLFQCLSGEFEMIWKEAPGLSDRARKKGDRWLACQSRPRTVAAIRTTLEERYRPPVPPAKLTARLTKIDPLTADMSEFTFQTPVPARFMPGQYVLLSITGEVQGARAYSMANLPNDRGEWRLVIKHKPGGACTDYLFRRLRLGDMVEIAGPYGMAYLPDGVERDLVCIAGGSGLSPILSVARKALGSGNAERKVHLFQGARRPADIVDPESFPDIRERAKGRLYFHPAISETIEVPLESWAGERGFIHEVVARKAPATIRDSEIFVAGPPPMIRETLLTLSGLGVPRGQIHFDNFF